jgi:hypothetical protein
MDLGPAAGSDRQQESRPKNMKEEHERTGAGGCLGGARVYWGSNHGGMVVQALAKKARRLGPMFSIAAVALAPHQTRLVKRTQCTVDNKGSNTHRIGCVLVVCHVNPSTHACVLSQLYPAALDRARVSERFEASLMWLWRYMLEAE